MASSTNRLRAGRYSGGLLGPEIPSRRALLAVRQESFAALWRIHAAAATNTMAPCVSTCNDYIHVLRSTVNKGVAMSDEEYRQWTRRACYIQSLRDAVARPMWTARPFWQRESVGCKIIPHADALFTAAMPLSP
jgi:hypothetical protein